MIDKTKYNDKKSYNMSFLPRIGSEEPIKDDWYETYELCRTFEAAHESDHDEKDVYTEDDAFPDSYNHGMFMHNQVTDERELEWERTKMNRTSTRTMWQKIATWKKKNMTSETE